MDDSWDVEAVVQYRTYYRKEQWLIKWQGYGEDRNTWEPKKAQGASAGGVGAAASRGGQAKGCGAVPVKSQNLGRKTSTPLMFFRRCCPDFTRTSAVNFGGLKFLAEVYYG